MTAASRLVLVRQPDGTTAYGCSSCAWTGKMPRVGVYGWTTKRARVASLRGQFVNHSCATHPKETT